MRSLLTYVKVNLLLSIYHEHTQPTLTCSKLTIEALDQDVKYVLVLVFLLLTLNR